MVKKAKLKLAIILSLIVGMSLVGQLGVDAINFIGGALLPKLVGDLFLIATFWICFGLMICSVYLYYQYVHKPKKKNLEFDIVILLGMVVAISHIGQYGIKAGSYLTHYLLPLWARHTLIFIIFWSAFIFTLIAISMYRKV